MAVASPVAGTGLGSSTVEYLENQVRTAGLAQIILHARKVAVGFYEKYDYAIILPSHTMLGVLRHFLMRKQL